MNADESRILFQNLEEIFERIFELELHNKKLRKKIQKKAGMGPGGYGKSGSSHTAYSTNQSDVGLKIDTQMGMLSPNDLLITGNTTDDILLKTTNGQPT